MTTGNLVSAEKMFGNARIVAEKAPRGDPSVLGLMFGTNAKTHDIKASRERAKTLGVEVDSVPSTRALRRMRADGDKAYMVYPMPTYPVAFSKSACRLSGQILRNPDLYAGLADHVWLATYQGDMRKVEDVGPLIGLETAGCLDPISGQVVLEIDVRCRQWPRLGQNRGDPNRVGMLSADVRIDLFWGEFGGIDLPRWGGKATGIARRITSSSSSTGVKLKGVLSYPLAHGILGGELNRVDVENDVNHLSWPVELPGLQMVTEKKCVELNLTDGGSGRALFNNLLTKYQLNVGPNDSILGIITAKPRHVVYIESGKRLRESSVVRAPSSQRFAFQVRDDKLVPIPSLINI